MKVIDINGLSKKYGSKTVLNNLDLEISQGDFIGIIGKSGSGKSTLINIIGMLDVSYSGRYMFDGKIVPKKNGAELSALRSLNFGYVFQMYNLINKYTVKDNILLPVLYSKSKKYDDDYYHELLMNLHIDHLEKQYAIDLSGGEKQRVALARAAILKPDVIIADEPTGNLDPENTSEVINMLGYLNDLGTSIIMVTHNMDVAYKTHRVLELKEGRLV